MINNPVLYYIKGFEPISAEQEKNLLATVSQQKAERIKRLVFEKDRSRSLYGLLLLQKIMHDQGYTNFNLKQLEHPKNQKPIITEQYNPSNIDFNITHSGEVIACAAISHALIGLDTEQIQNKQHKLSEHFMSPDEINWIGDNELRFLEIWTKKEALIKVDPQGKLMQLRSIKLLNNQQGKINGQHYHLQAFSLADTTVTHMACSKAIVNVQCQEIKSRELLS